MMRVSIPPDKDFNYLECKKMFELYKNILNEDASFDEILKNTLFYAFYDGSKLSLCVYFYSDKGKIWVNGYGIRKNHLFNQKCFNLVLSWFDCDIWAKSSQKPAIFGIMSCGFKKFKDDIYLYSKKNDN